MQAQNQIPSTDMKIRIKKSKAKEDISIDPFLTGFKYSISNDTNYIEDKEKNAWAIKGRMERIIFEDDVLNIVSFPDITLFDLCGCLSRTTIRYEIKIKDKEGKKTKIEDADFYNYGRIFKANCLAMEEIYFDGTMDYKK